MKKIFLFSLFFVLFSCTLLAQKNEEVDKLIKAAVTKMDNGYFDESIKLLDQALDIDSKNSVAKYEKSYAYYLKKDYKTSIKMLKKLVKEDSAKDYYYQMMGNAYDLDGNPNMALETYKLGLEKFPNSGKLFLEIGNVYYIKKNYEDAIDWYEKGIAADPSYPSNYFRAAYLFLNSDNEVWGMIYGEIFMNLERNSKRTATMSEMLYNTYKSEIKIKNDTLYGVSFCNGRLNLSNEDADNMNKMDAKGLKEIFTKNNVSYGLGVYEPLIMRSIVGESEINLASLNRIRTNFLNTYFDKKYNEEYPVVIFNFQKMAQDSGYFEAYNYWLLSQGNEEAFTKWKTENSNKFDAFVNWMNNTELIINDKNKLERNNIDK